MDRRKLASEFLGTAFLLTAVVGSGIMGERLAGGNAAIVLLANSIATGAALFVLIQVLTPFSGAHLNPFVTLALAAENQIPKREVAPYLIAQCAGAVVGVWTTHLMFGLPIFQFSTHVRTGVGQWVGEFVATFGLLMVIGSGRRYFVQGLPAAVALYIVAAYWFTSSTSFANPAVAIARSLTDSFSGISPASVGGFLAAEGAGAVMALLLARRLQGSPTT